MIDLDKILATYSANFKGALNVNRQDKASLTGKEAKEAMKEAIKQALELAANEAVTKAEKKSQFGKYRKWQKIKEGEDFDLFKYHMKISVNKKSITNIINQVK